MSKVARLAFVGALVASPFLGAPDAEAHGGGLDSTGGHHCRQAGYDSGKCAPLNSYHCHQSPCGEAAPATTVRRATTTTVRRTTTTAARAAAATTTTVAPTTTTSTEPTTTTSTEPTTTTTMSTTTTTPPAAPVTAPIKADKDEQAGPGETALGLATLGGMAYGGLRLYRLVRRRLPQRS